VLEGHVATRVPWSRAETPHDLALAEVGKVFHALLGDSPQLVSTSLLQNRHLEWRHLRLMNLTSFTRATLIALSSTGLAAAQND